CPEAVEAVVAAEGRRMVADQILLPEVYSAMDTRPVAAFYTSALGKRVLASPKVLRECPFNYEVPAGLVVEQWTGEKKVILQGMIDCCFLENDGWILLDYKTDRWRTESKREGLVDRYRIQIDIYARALKALTGKPVTEKILCFLSMGENIEMV
ncbi:MAG: PD-(D/E)XK nuclease family protein, partial [Eubacteriaceae bacterium]|nr:PD-(D/E)XK nuclease family protein [Eubacteriaceae bacterium]